MNIENILRAAQAEAIMSFFNNYDLSDRWTKRDSVLFMLFTLSWFALPLMVYL